MPFALENGQKVVELKGGSKESYLMMVQQWCYVVEKS